MKTIKRISIVLTLLVFTFSVIAKAPDVKLINTAKPIELSKIAFQNKVFDFVKNGDNWNYVGDKPAIIDFYATWCGPCKQLSPVLAELAAEYGEEIYIYKVDVDKEPEIAQAFGIRSLPSLLFIPQDGAPQMGQGNIPKASLKKVIDEFMLAKQKSE